MSSLKVLNHCSPAILKGFEKTFSIIKIKELDYGFAIRVLFFLLNDIIVNGDCGKSLVKLDELFSCLDNTCEIVRHSVTASNKVNLVSKNELMLQLQTRNIHLFDFFQVVGAMLFFHIIIYKAKVLLVCGHQLEARKALHNGLEVCRMYFGFVLQSPGIILFDAPVDDAGRDTSGKIHDARLSSIVKDYLCSFNRLNSTTIDATVTQNLVVSHITHLLRTGTILCAQIEHVLGNHTVAKTLLNDSVVQTEFIPSELRHNEGCVALHLRELHRASLLFHLSVDATCVVLRQKTLWNDISKSDLGAGLYCAGLSLLKLSRPLDAFPFFALAVTVADFGDRPHVWVRLAECCLQREAFQEIETAFALTSTSPPAVGLLPFMESISNSRSRRVFLRPHTIEEPPKEGLSNGAATENGCDLSSAVVYLKRALNLSVRSMALVEKSVERGSLVNDILLRLGFACLKVRDCVGAVTFARRLDSRLIGLPSTSENVQIKYLNCSYLVQALCMLGKFAEASELFKSRVDADCTDDAILNCVVPPKSFLRPSFTAPDRGIARAAQQVNKAIVLLLRGYTSAALTLVEAALRVCADYAPAVRCLLFIYIRQGRSRHALNVMNAYKLSIEHL